MISSSTARFEDRSLNLVSCFDTKRMLKSWKNYVLDGLRKQSVLDLHDYYDFNRNKIGKIEVLRKQIINGSYRPKLPIIVRLEKKYGVTRHLPIPSPEDAVILQTISDYLIPYVDKAQPTNKAFYSRSHGFLGEASVDESFPYPWWELWPAFQKRIYNFTNKFNYIVVTDISNYYDNIKFKNLRNSLSSIGKFDEVLLDLLFYLLESFVWRPDYLPFSGMGLPQLNFDAPRLLAHAFLFDVDRFLEKKTTGNFVRWMDDIDFGVNDVHEAKNILKELDEILLVKGLRLNMGKTKILSSSEAKDYFMPDENRWISVMTKRVDRLKLLNKPLNKDIAMIKRKFNLFLKKSKAGRWSKVYGRYFTLAKHVGSGFLDKYIPDLLTNYPDMRDNIFRYYIDLGYNKKRLNVLIDFYNSEDCSDETTIFSVMNVLVSWRINRRSAARADIIDLANRTSGVSKIYFVASLWLLAKYGLLTDIVKIIYDNEDKWMYSGFMARQVASVLPRIRNSAHDYKKILDNLYQTGHLDALSIMYHHESLRLYVPTSTPELMYYMHGSSVDPLFPLQKIIIVENILTNNIHPKIDRIVFRNKILSRLNDPVHKEIIRATV